MFRFGCTPTADRAAAEQLQQQGPILEELIQALQEREHADAHLREVCQVGENMTGLCSLAVHQGSWLHW